MTDFSIGYWVHCPPLRILIRYMSRPRRTDLWAGYNEILEAAGGSGGTIVRL
jgi:hypothetical protein